MKIADASNGRCVARGISIMRLALGYEEPFPIEYSPEGYQMPGLIGDCFPNHNVLLFCGESVVEGIEIPSNVEYLGDFVDGYCLNNYLWSFSYFTETEKVHLVIGSPSGSLDFYQVFAIELEE